jgi:2-polyprenyl-6-methoxyphenol hydroxylase-like FAD-dependent oxidoreductase
VTNDFADVGWECPQILAALVNVGSIYFDRASQIRLDRWTKGRTALVGDAAACVSLMAGQGSILSMAEAYMLAGELRICGGDYGAAFALRAAADAVSEAQAVVGGEVRFVHCPEDGVRHSVPQPGRAADAAAAVRGGFLHRPRTAGSGRAPRLWVLTEA